MSKDGLWNVGQFLSASIGCLVWYEYNIIAGVAVSFTCQLLVDIRRELQELKS